MGDCASTMGVSDNNCTKDDSYPEIFTSTAQRVVVNKGAEVSIVTVQFFIFLGAKDPL